MSIRWKKPIHFQTLIKIPLSNKLDNKIITTLAVLFFLFLMLPLAGAATKDDIVYPVEELGGCKNEKECRLYCDQPDNFAACFAFAKKHNLLEGPIANKEASEVEKLSQSLRGGAGPGGCQGFDECRAYCDDVANINECVAYAEKYDVMDRQELEEAKKIRDALARGVKTPGSCRNKEECETYCFGAGGPDGGDFKPERMDECIKFGVAAGFMTEQEASIVKKTGGVGPGGCRGRACEKHCDNPANEEVCFAFAIEHGIIGQEEARFARKIKEKTGCRNRQECEKVFDAKPELAEQFFEEIKKENPDFNFNKIIPKGESGRIKEEVRRRINEETGNAPPGITECVGPKLEELLNSPDFNPFEMRTKMPEIMRGCFADFTPPGLEDRSFPSRQEEFPGRQDSFPDKDYQGPPPPSLEGLNNFLLEGAPTQIPEQFRSLIPENIDFRSIELQMQLQQPQSKRIESKEFLGLVAQFLLGWF